jgi:hypothetical protein
LFSSKLLPQHFEILFNLTFIHKSILALFNVSYFRLTNLPRLCKKKWCEEAATLLPRGELVVIKGGIHATNYDSPAALARLIRAFLARVCLPARTDATP